jgi:uncharacterized protein YbjT (DUF2867 family)
MRMKINPIITGATGMVGEGVLHECLKHPEVESVLVINRKPCGVVHHKLKEIIHKDFNDLSAVKDQLAGYNTCYFCAGVTSIGKKEEEYKKITYDLTLNFAKTLFEINNDMIFCYVSGEGTDSTENGKLMWARVKGKTENDILRMGFKKAYMFRPGYIKPIKGLRNSYKISKAVAPSYPMLEKLFPSHVVTLEELGKAMINAALKGSEKKILECEDIRELAS